MGQGHVPVLVEDVLDGLQCRSGGTYLDCTVGLGGHAARILERIGREGLLVGIELDPEALALARGSLAGFGDRVRLVHGDFRDLEEILDRLGVAQVDGVLFDLGVSSLQLDRAERGFGFRRDAPLDMRMNPSSGRTAGEMVNTLDEEALRDLLWRYGEERRARAIARAMVRRRAKKPIATTGELAALVESVVPRRRGERIHPATRTFQALRIAVNNELEKLAPALEAAVDRLKPRGRIAIIAFHSLEDRIVKHALRDLARGCICPPDFPQCCCGRSPRVRVVTPRPIRPGPAELQRNPRARSARLRVAEHVE